MAYEYNGKTIETNDQGYLVNPDEWDEGLAAVIAKEEDIDELTEKHWDIINYLRDEYYNNAQNQPNERAIVKAMSEKWGTKLGQGDTFALFPKMPSKQGGKIAGLPESRRKGGY
jgi:tRNA 2-thiouridine synthesizing protein E